MADYRVGQVLSLTYDDVKALPIGTVVTQNVDRHGFDGPRMIKTSDCTWSWQWSPVTAARVAEDVKRRANAISPGPIGRRVRITTLPKTGCDINRKA